MKRLVFLALLLALPAMAVEPDDADYYKRTATKPPIDGNWALGFGINHVDRLGVDVLAGYTFNKHGITILGRVGAVQLEGENGTTEFRRHCRTYQVPFSIGDRTEAEVGVSVLFQLKKYK